MANAGVEISFFIDGKPWARKLWASVPRVGDEVMLGAGRNDEFSPDAHGKASFCVKRVVWGVEGERPQHQCANIEIELAT